MLNLFPNLYNTNMLKLFGLNKKSIYQDELKADIACSFLTFENCLFQFLNI